jgi:hypothetical protein
MSVLTESEQLEIENLSALFFTPDEIIAIMNLKGFNDFRVKESDFNIPFMRGRLKKEAEVRTSIFNLAVNGSSPAQILAIDIIEKSELKSIKI